MQTFYHLRQLHQDNDHAKALINPSILHYSQLLVLFVKKKEFDGRKKNEYPVTVHTLNVESAIKAAAKEKNPTLYFEIKDADLIARELRYHNTCYNAFAKETTLSAGHTQSVDEQSNLDEEVEEQQTGDFESICEYIIHHVFEEKTAVFMSVLHTIYGLSPSDSRYRSKLKDRIMKRFKDQINFLPVGPKTPEILVDASSSVSELAFKDKSGCIIKAAEYLPNDVISYSQNLPTVSWPLQAEELQRNDELLPPNLLLFLRHMLHSQISKRKPSDSVDRAVHSIASDLVAGVINGKIMTAKQCLLALGLHNITGTRKVVDIVNCINYKITCEIETTQAVKSSSPF